MRYGIFSLESANAIAWFDSRSAAIEGLQKLLIGEPDAVDAVGLMEFDDHGHPQEAVQGEALWQLAGVDRPVTA